MQFALAGMESEEVAAAASALGLNAAQTAVALSATKMEVSEIALKLAMKGYNQEAVAAALATAGFSESEINAAVTSEVFATAEHAAAAATNTFTASIARAVKGLWAFLTTNPAGWAILFASSIAIAVGAVNYFTTTFDEALSKAEESSQAYDDQKSKVKSLKEELESTGEKIAELESIGPLSPVEEEDLKNLREENALLQQQLEIEQAIAQYKQQDAAKDAKEALNKRDFYTYDSDESGGSGYRAAHHSAQYIKNKVDIVDATTEKQNYLNSLTEKRNKLIEEQNSLLDKNGEITDRKKFDSYTKEIKKENDNIRTIFGEITENWSTISELKKSFYDEDGNILKGFEDEAKRIDELGTIIYNYAHELNRTTNDKQDEINSFLSKDEFSDYVDAVMEKATELNGISVDDFKGQFPELAEAAEDAGFEIEDVVNSINASIGAVNTDQLKYKLRDAFETPTMGYEAIKSYVDAAANAQTEFNHVLLDGESISASAYERLLSFVGGEEEALEGFVDKSRGYLVTNAEWLHNFVDSIEDDARSTLKLAESQQELKYHELVAMLRETCDGLDRYDGATMSVVDALFEQIDATELQIRQYKMLEQQLLGATSAFDKLKNAQEVDSERDYTDEFSDSISGLIKAFENHEFGTEYFKTAFDAFIPEDIYGKFTDAGDQIDAGWDYLNTKLARYFSFDSGNVSIDFDNIKKFIQDGLNTAFDGSKVFLGGLESFDLNPQITTLKQFADAMGVTETAAFALGNAISKYTSDHDDFLSKLSMEGAELETQIISCDQRMAELLRKQTELGKAGKVGSEDWKKLQKDIESAGQEMEKLKKKARENLSASITIESDIAEKQAEIDALKNSLEQLDENTAEYSAAMGNYEAAKTELDELIQKKYDLGEPTQIKVELALDQINEEIDQVKAKITDSLSRDDLWKLQEQTAQLRELEKLKQEKHNIEIYAGIANKDELDEDLEHYKEFKIDDKEFKISANTQAAEKALNGILDQLKDIEKNKNKTVTVTVKEKKESSGDDSDGGKSSGKSSTKSSSSKSGRSKYAGTAHAKGVWGTDRAEKDALVGELGEEIVVDPRTGIWRTVGDNGAELIDLPKGSIVFNHRQTEQILKNRRIDSRGRAYAWGNAHFSDFDKKSYKFGTTSNGSKNDVNVNVNVTVSGDKISYGSTVKPDSVWDNTKPTYTPENLEYYQTGHDNLTPADVAQIRKDAEEQEKIGKLKEDVFKNSLAFDEEAYKKSQSAYNHSPLSASGWNALDLGSWNEINYSLELDQATKELEDQRRYLKGQLDAGLIDEKTYFTLLKEWGIKRLNFFGSTKLLNSVLSEAENGLIGLSGGGSNAKRIQDAYIGVAEYGWEYKGGSSSGSGKNDIYEKVKEKLDELLGDYEHEIFTMERVGADPEKIIEVYQKMKDAVHDTAEEYREMGLDENSDYIQDLQKQWWQYEHDIQDIIAKGYENAIKLHEDWMQNDKESGDFSGVAEHADKIVEYYRKRQELLHEQAEYYRNELGLSDISDEITGLMDTYWQFDQKIKEVKTSVIENLADMVDAAFKLVDEAQTVHDTLWSAAKEFEEYGGYITIDTYQDILALGPQYMQMLRDENGLFIINEERIRDIIKARTQQLALDNALTYVERLRLAQQEGSVEDLNELLYATVDATGATWDLVYANLALLGLGDKEREAAIHNINAIRSLGDIAADSVGKAGESLKGSYDSILKYVMDMLKQKIEDQIGALEDMKDAYGEIIDLKKESLEAADREAKSEKARTAKLREIAKLQAKIDALSLDDSRSAQAERAKLLEELTELQDDLNETQSDKALEAAKDSLDGMKEAYDAEKDGEIEKLRDSISSQQKIYEMAVDYIRHYWETNWDDLKVELLQWNYDVGNSLQSEIETAWDNCMEYIQNHPLGIDGVLSNQEGQSGQGDIVGASGKYDDEARRYIETAGKVTKMKENSAEWGRLNKFDDGHNKEIENRKRELEIENRRYAAQIESILGEKLTLGADGWWYLPNGEKLYVKYGGKYHTGGFAGEQAMKPNERYVKVEDGELILTSDQQDSLAAQLDRIGALSEAFGHSVMDMPVNARSLWPDGSNAVGGSVSNVTNNARTVEVNFGDTIINGAKQDTLDRHVKVTRDMMNQIGNILRRGV